MSTAKTFTIAYATVDGFPAGSRVDQILINVTDPSGVVAPITVPAATTSVPYTAAAAGTYSVSAQAFQIDPTTGNGSALGDAVTTTFTVAADTTVTLSIPSAISVA